MTTPAPYAIAPDYAGKFKPSAAKEILAAVLNEKLAGKEFSADLTTQWTKEIADEVKTRLKGRPTEPAPTRGGLASTPAPPQRALHDVRYALFITESDRAHRASWCCACASGGWVCARRCGRHGAELNLERYKFVVQVVIGEQRGEGVR